MVSLAREFKISQVHCNRDYEPYAKVRDQQVEEALGEIGVSFHQYQDSVIFESNELLSAAGTPYRVFTAYKNKWLERFEASAGEVAEFVPDLKRLHPFKQQQSILQFDWFKTIGLSETKPFIPAGSKVARRQLQRFLPQLADYQRARDYPAQAATSGLSTYLRHGNISIRQMVRAARSEHSEGARVWLSELIWRDFYQMILDTNPQLEKEAYRPVYDQIKWSGKEAHFKAWCQGKTGVPLVDAAMRCLNATGTMHNRLRMVVASYLCKILLINWRQGERYFAQKLLDYDLAANNGGWQWSAGSGCDAQPYFRIFNPYLQSKKFDPTGEFIRRWCPELADLSAKEIHRPPPLKNYPAPVVNYELQRLACIQMYSEVTK